MSSSKNDSKIRFRQEPDQWSEQSRWPRPAKKWLCSWCLSVKTICCFFFSDLLLFFSWIYMRDTAACGAGPVSAQGWHFNDQSVQSSVWRLHCTGMGYAQQRALDYSTSSASKRNEKSFNTKIPVTQKCTFEMYGTFLVNTYCSKYYSQKKDKSCK
jgi:hypothetical protein